MIKIVIPANMPTVINHLELAGKKVQFPEDQDLGRIEDGNIQGSIIRLRSFDIPVVVDDSCDVGLCGSDVYEERKLTFPLNLAVLERFAYGRVFGTNPTLDLVGPLEDGVKNPKEFKPGTIILTEHPNLTKKFLEGHSLKVSILGENSHQPKVLPKEFRDWCTKEGTVGIQVVHGRIPALVRLGAGYGVMVNETGNTRIAYGLKIVARVADIEILLIADREALADIEKGKEIRRLQEDLKMAYLSISQEYESLIIRREKEF